MNLRRPASPLDARAHWRMTTRAYRTSGVLLLFASLIAAFAIQFFGGGLLEVLDAHETGPGANGSAGGFVVSMVLKIRWPAVIPLLLGGVAVICLIMRGNAQPIR